MYQEIVRGNTTNPGAHEKVRDATMKMSQLKITSIKVKILLTNIKYQKQWSLVV